MNSEQYNLKKHNINRHETFINLLSIKNKHFKEGFFTVESIYRHNKEKVLLKTKYGFCKMSSGQLLKGHKPDIGNSLDKEEYALNLIKDKLENVNYKILKYISSFNIIVEDEFGKCKMSLDSLIRGYQPSINSAIDKTKYFISKLKKVNNNLDFNTITFLSEYKDKQTKILIQDSKSVHLVSPSSLYKLKKLSITTSIDKSEYYINQYAKKGFQYLDYKYNNYKSIIKVKCIKHNRVFEHSVTEHKYCKTCCPDCSKYSSYVYEEWANINPDNEGIFYIIRCFNKDESFYKFGITSNSIKERYNNNKSMPYNYDIIFSMESKNRRFIWVFEKYFEYYVKNFKYRPKIFFKGCINECFIRK